MHRIAFLLTVLGLAALSTGCTMCAHPHDYCGPTFTGGCRECCDPDARAGSILSGSMTEPLSESVEGEVISDRVLSEDMLPVPEGDEQISPDLSQRGRVPLSTQARRSTVRRGRPAYR